MPLYRIYYTQPVHVTYTATVVANDTIEALRKLLAVEGGGENQEYRNVVKNDVEHDDSASEIIWDAMEPLQFGYITDIEELGERTGSSPKEF